ncbi:hypothetical protein Dimus_010379, partial [Dionaea muscipula]
AWIVMAMTSGVRDAGGGLGRAISVHFGQSRLNHYKDKEIMNRDGKSLTLYFY